jgi:NifU-like protein involved in Fe-S cluster formation/bacterioferritin-associated ferredoxin
MSDVQSSDKSQSWFYSPEVKDHFFHPRNFMTDEMLPNYRGAALGMVGSPACGDMMKIWIVVKRDLDSRSPNAIAFNATKRQTPNPSSTEAINHHDGADEAQERIIDLKWQTFGCASAIASTSMLSVIVTENGGMTLDEARKVRPQDIMERLGGLPARKIHCSVLGDKALRAAINDYYRRTNQPEKIEVEQGRIIDRVLKVTDKDIEDAVVEGARTLEEVQAKTKAGTGDPTCVPEVEQLVRFYREKYTGA